MRRPFSIRQPVLYTVAACLFVFPGIVTAQTSDINVLRTLISDLNTGCDTGTMTLTLASDIEVTAEAPNQAGNALPFINQQCTVNPIVIDGNGHTLSRSPGATDEFRLIGVMDGANLPGDLTLRNITLSGFQLTGFDGGAIYVDNGAKLTLESVVFENNRALGNSGDGGAIYNLGSVTVTPRSVNGATPDQLGATFINNQAFRGGAIYSESRLTLNGVDIVGNTANAGGGIYLNQSSSLARVSNSIIDGNSASEGGGIFGYNSSLGVNRSTIEKNVGGGINMAGLPNPPPSASRSILDINSSTISGNQYYSNGSALQLRGMFTEISRTTITKNQGSNAIEIRPLQDGDGYLGKLDMEYSILSANDPGILDNHTEISCENGDHNFFGGNIILRNNLIGDSRVTRGQGISQNCEVRDDLESSNLFAFSDDFNATPPGRIVAPLADNGCGVASGAGVTSRCTRTHALPGRSPAVDADRVARFSGSDQRYVFFSGTSPEILPYPDYGSHEGVEILDEMCTVLKGRGRRYTIHCW